MSAPRVFVAGIHESGDAVELAPDDARKLRVVLRAKNGDVLEIVDSSGRVYAGELDVRGERMRARLRAEKSPLPAPSLRITLAQAVPKGAKMDYVVEKATELGIARILPFQSDRTVAARPHDGKAQRWQRIAQTASRQCGRADVPPVEESAAFAQLCARMRDFDVTLLAWELAPRVPLHERLAALLAGAHDILVVIGPEGGLSSEEAQRAEQSGATPVSLGARILRTETAGLVVCSALLYERGDL